MPREIQVVDTCDACAAEGDPGVPATEMPPIQIGNVKPRVILFCESHEKELVGRLREILLEYGQVVDTLRASLPAKGRPQSKQLVLGGGEAHSPQTITPTDSKKGYPHPCPKQGDRGCKFVGASRARISGHMRQFHNVLLAEVETEMGHTLEGEELRFTCPECKLGFVANQGVSAHRRAEHKVGLAQQRANPPQSYKPKAKSQ